MASFEEIEAALAMAREDAAARIQAAATQAKAQVDAAVQSTTISAEANRDIAQIEASWRRNGFDTEFNAAQYTADANRDAAIQSADKDAEARKDVAHTQGQATVDAARADADARRYAADAQREGTTQAAEADRAGRVEAAALDANARIQAAQLDANAQTTVATTRANADTQVATITTSNQVAVAQIDAAARTTVASTTGSFSVQAANVEAGARVQSAGIEADASKYGSDKQLAGVNAHEAAETGRLNLKLDFANDKFTLLQPLLDQIINSGSSFLDGLNGGGQAVRLSEGPRAPLGFRMSAAVGHPAATSGPDAVGYGSTLRMGPIDPPSDGGTGGGGSTAGNVTITAPFIGTRGVLTPAMLQQQVNQAYARNDSRTQALIRQAQGDLAGRGFSATSPILDALKVGYITGNLRASIEAASQIRLQAAQANCDAVFRSQQARSEQYLAQENVLIQAEQNVIQRQVGVLNAISSLVGGIL
jgi:hypothetical protein